MNSKLIALGLTAGLALIGCGGKYSDPLRKYPNLKNDVNPSEVRPTLNLIGLDKESYKFGDTETFQLEVNDLRGNESQAPEIDCRLESNPAESYDISHMIYETKRESLRNGKWTFTYMLDTTVDANTFGPKSKSGFGETTCMAVSATTSLISNPVPVKIALSYVSQKPKTAGKSPAAKESKP